jgi:hypothetical protein
MQRGKVAPELSHLLEAVLDQNADKYGRYNCVVVGIRVDHTALLDSIGLFSITFHLLSLEKLIFVFTHEDPM